MFLRAMLVWFCILGFAILNGAFRDLILLRPLGDTMARALSTVFLCAAVAVAAWVAIGWIAPAGAREALLIGVLWAAMTLGFEFFAGHYLFRKDWVTLLEDYDVTRGRIWIAVPLVTLLAPLWAARARGLFLR
jgi:hypothetical protein